MKNLRYLPLGLAVMLSDPAAANLLTNPGFETGDLTGWTINPGMVYPYVDPFAHTGSYSFSGYDNAGQSGISQALSGTAGSTYQVSGYVYTDGSAGNSAALQLGSGTIVSLAEPTWTWTSFSEILTADEDNPTINFLLGTCSGCGVVFFDDLSVILLTTPVLLPSYTVAEAAPSLLSQGSSLTAMSRNTSLVINGAHSRPLSRHVAEGETTFWVAGDWGNDNHGARDGNSNLAEVGFGYNFGPVQINATLGKTWADMDYDNDGSIEADSKYLMIESLIPLPQMESVVITLGAYYASGEANTRRGYLAALVQNYSEGDTDTKAWGVRARIDWEDAATLAGTHISPYADLTYTRSIIDGYTEYGGAHPASFDESKENITEFRLGLNTATAIGSSEWNFISTAEAVHSFSDEAETISGTITSIAGDFHIEGEEYDQSWLRLGLGVEGKLGAGKASLMLNGTTDGEAPSSWVAASYQVNF